MLSNKEKSKQMRKQFNMSQKKWADFLGLPLSTITQAETGTRGIGASYNLAVYKKFKIDFDSYNGEELILCNNDSIQNDIIPVTVYNNVKAAGAGTFVYDENIDKNAIKFDKKFLKFIVGVSSFKNLSIIQAKGDSMDNKKESSIKDGEYLLVDNSQKEGQNQVFIIRMNDELRVKRISYTLDGTLLIKSDNPDYKDEIYKPDEQDITIEVIGKVVWNLSKGAV